jgi:hypothetical protein
MIAVLLVLLIFSVALAGYLSTEIVALNRELRQIRQADIDDMNQLDAWVTQQEHKGAV